MLHIIYIHTVLTCVWVVQKGMGSNDKDQVAAPSDTADPSLVGMINLSIKEIIAQHGWDVLSDWKQEDLSRLVCDDLKIDYKTHRLILRKLWLDIHVQVYSFCQCYVCCMLTIC